MKPEHHQLLHDLLDGADAAAQRDAVLSAGHRVLRRRRQMRYLSRALTVAACATLAILGINRLAVLQPPAPVNNHKLATAPPAAAAPQLEKITDDELLALFPGTPVGLVKVNGKQRLIFPRPGDEERFVTHL
jgi:hypothetical protein